MLENVLIQNLEDDDEEGFLGGRAGSAGGTLPAVGVVGDSEPANPESQLETLPVRCCCCCCCRCRPLGDSSFGGLGTAVLPEGPSKLSRATADDEAVGREFQLTIGRPNSSRPRTPPPLAPTAAAGNCRVVGPLILRPLTAGLTRSAISV